MDTVKKATTFGDLIADNLAGEKITEILRMRMEKLISSQQIVRESQAEASWNALMLAREVIKHPDYHHCITVSMSKLSAAVKFNS